MCRWLAQGGAAHVVAISRSAVRTEKIKLLEEEMRELGAQLHMAKCDISDSGEVAKLFCDLRERGLPLVRGLFHCAMVLQVNQQPNQSLVLAAFAETLLTTSNRILSLTE